MAEVARLALQIALDANAPRGLVLVDDDMVALSGREGNLAAEQRTYKDISVEERLSRRVGREANDDGRLRFGALLHLLLLDEVAVNVGGVHDERKQSREFLLGFGRVVGDGEEVLQDGALAVGHRIIDVVHGVVAMVDARL